MSPVLTGLIEVDLTWKKKSLQKSHVLIFLIVFTKTESIT